MADSCNNCTKLLRDPAFSTELRCGARAPYFLGATYTGKGVFPFVELAWWCGDWAAWDPATVVINGGDAQISPADQDVPIAPSVLVTDGSGRPVPGVDVTFAVTLGGGSVTPPGGVATTGIDGVATVGSWKLGIVPGANVMEATVEGAGIIGNPVIITATGT